MLNKVIDLYKYFKLDRPKGGQGYLTTYLLNKNHGEWNKEFIRPAMLVLPGGGYEFCSKREGEPIALTYNAKGYSSFVLEYSVAPIGYPYQLLEACMSMLYIRENAKELGVDSEHISAMGFSAGGHLCGSLGLLYNAPEIKKFLGDKVSLCRPNAIILAYAVLTFNEYTHKGTMENVTKGDKKLLDRLSLEKAVNVNAPPAFIWATNEDTLVPAENSLQMALAYRKAGVPVELHIFEKGGHGLSLATEEVYVEEKSVAVWVDLSVTWLKGQGFNVMQK